jgi:hypothetical protein
MNSKSNTGEAFSEVYEQKISENIDVLERFPASLQAAFTLSETMSPSEDGTTSLKIKTAVSECLNSMRALMSVAADLDLLLES